MLKLTIMALSQKSVFPSVLKVILRAGTHAWVIVRRPEDNLELSSNNFQVGFLKHSLSLAGNSPSQLNWLPSKPWDLPASGSPAPLLQACATTQGSSLYLGVCWGSSSRLHACLAGTLRSSHAPTPGASSFCLFLPLSPIGPIDRAYNSSNILNQQTKTALGVYRGTLDDSQD